MVEIYFNSSEFANLVDVEVAYTDGNNRKQEIRTELKFVSNDNFTVFFTYDGELDIKCPQNISIKFVIDNALYTSNTTLSFVKRVGKQVYFTIDTPKTMTQLQKRRSYRVRLNRVCILVATNEDGVSTTFMSRMIDVSVGGVLIHNLETMFNSKYVTIKPSDYVRFNIVLFLDTNEVYKLSARYVRQEKSDDSYRYAFEFVNISPSDANAISRYITKEQVEYLKSVKQV